ncbi:ABC transporter permease [Streptomyces rapamycinicus]|uniref:Spermidine/putrescine ABC transporter permease n=2 Tax=Streptomyces rapamycinicus TaxID=1226757 RepID=A0A0A0NWN8_STRRN|nr:ABC transporter permease [Streptomyces rapamycinicus]AGP60105.1 spermidine/putrescine ABC transporter permease [Streptomyces rapamycinicus NRRL 5491]MBB4788738.1 putative spermidine/putrescine transport system permease protein [Streptomyces rapamycinicus]RLV76712.1 spermidine/putrescine ABC transporter permease [Streptomyces rapamycinicus NRRL 5491]UTO67748.1 ABC transporter permease [Streptomyces rapamycinicus]UTP35694.1 ABC transporter permease [Streptomyces rapamycinicus NRRL 5491]
MPAAPTPGSRLRLTALLAPPLLWLTLAYLGSLGILLLSAFWATDSFTSDVVHTWNTDNFHELLTTPVYRTIALRTLSIAVAVTVIDALLALPMAFCMARVAGRRWRRPLLVAVLTPLWAGYLVKAYAWRVMLGEDGVVGAALAPFGLHGPGYGTTAVIIVLAYLWLPYMILPVYAALERLPERMLEASADLGAGAWRTLRSVVLPAVRPAVFAGSVFTFSLSLGDYLTVQIVGGKTQLLGNVIASQVTLDLPMAAALSAVPVVLIVCYLAAVRRAGALDSL